MGREGGTFTRGRKLAKSAQRACPQPPGLRHTVLHGTKEVGYVSNHHISETGGERLLPGPGDLVMQVREERPLSSRRACYLSH